MSFETPKRMLKLDYPEAMRRRAVHVKDEELIKYAERYGPLGLVVHAKVKKQIDEKVDALHPNGPRKPPPPSSKTAHLNNAPIYKDDEDVFDD
jgi:hypothetical protein